MSEYIITEKQLKTATEAYSELEVPLPITEVFISGDKLPEIVRCRDCMCRAKACCWCINGGAEPDGYCAWGERRDA